MRKSILPHDTSHTTWYKTHEKEKRVYWAEGLMAEEKSECFRRQRVCPQSLTSPAWNIQSLLFKYLIEPPPCPFEGLLLRSLTGGWRQIPTTRSRRGAHGREERQQLLLRLQPETDDVKANGPHWLLISDQIYIQNTLFCYLITFFLWNIS